MIDPVLEDLLMELGFERVRKSPLVSPRVKQAYQAVSFLRVFGWELGSGRHTSGIYVDIWSGHVVLYWEHNLAKQQYPTYMVSIPFPEKWPDVVQKLNEYIHLAEKKVRTGRIPGQVDD